MNGIHDMGGMEGMGPLEIEKNEPVFHHDWEKRVMGMFPTTFAAGGYNLDEFRHAIERMGALEYLDSSYYEHWLHAFETVLVANGLISADELSTGKADPNAEKIEPALAPEAVPKIVSHGASARIDIDAKPKFKEGDMVIVKNINPSGHTRLPRYVRDKLGCIDKDHGVFVFPDSSAHGKGEKPQHCYSVYFSAQEVWGAGASANDSIFVDLWDDYLVSARDDD
ncbi:MAG: nitrile hydratase subunit beta [Pseudomonadota bacterium]